MFVKNAQALAGVLSVAFVFSGCGNSFRGQLMNTWTLSSITCNSVVDSAYQTALAGGASVVMLVEDGTFRKTFRNASSSCSHVRTGTYTTIGEMVSFVNSGTVSCTPSPCSLQTEFAQGSSVCAAANSGTSAPTVAFRSQGNVIYMDLTSTADCNNDGTATDTKIETYQR
jgi:hypothetical protein